MSHIYVLRCDDNIKEYLRMYNTHISNKFDVVLYKKHNNQKPEIYIFHHVSVKTLIIVFMNKGLSIPQHLVKLHNCVKSSCSYCTKKCITEPKTIKNKRVGSWMNINLSKSKKYLSM